MNRIKKIVYKKYCIFLSKIAPEKYKETFPRYLRKIGIRIPENYREGKKGFIHPTVQFDGNDYSLISIGKNTTISSDVVVLTHDYSIGKGLSLLSQKRTGRFLKPVTIGENCFIGLRSILLPGTEIGNNVIIGAGSVVKGKIPANGIYAGNPAKFICSIEEWTEKHIQKNDIVNG